MGFLEKFKSHKIPNGWENVFELMIGDDPCMIFNLQPGSHEWKTVESNFKQTM
jgi:hypothetical protein